MAIILARHIGLIYLGMDRCFVRSVLCCDAIRASRSQFSTLSALGGMDQGDRAPKGGGLSPREICHGKVNSGYTSETVKM